MQQVYFVVNPLLLYDCRIDSLCFQVEDRWQCSTVFSGIEVLFFFGSYDGKHPCQCLMVTPLGRRGRRSVGHSKDPSNLVIPLTSVVPEKYKITHHGHTAWKITVMVVRTKYPVVYGQQWGQTFLCVTKHTCTQQSCGRQHHAVCHVHHTTVSYHTGEMESQDWIIFEGR